MPGIEENVHFVWIGSKLKQKHVKRISLWKELNPQYHHTVWVEAAYASEITEQLSGKNITVRLVTELNISNDLNTLINNLSKKQTISDFPNYAAVSDGWRNKILHDFGGWYFDTDVVPINLSRIKINAHFNFHINGDRTNNLVNVLAPCAIAASSKNPLMVKALIILEEMGKLFTENEYQAIRSREASIRYLSTMESTGVVLRLALASTKHNNIPLIEMFTDDEGRINHIDVFDSISTRFESAMEQSWILSNVEPVDNKPGFNSITPLSGIHLDKDYSLALMDAESAYLQVPIPRSLYIIQKSALAKANLVQNNKPIEKLVSNVGANSNTFYYESTIDEKNTVNRVTQANAII